MFKQHSQKNGEQFNIEKRRARRKNKGYSHILTKIIFKHDIRDQQTSSLLQRNSFLETLSKFQKFYTLRPLYLQERESLLTPQYDKVL